MNRVRIDPCEGSVLSMLTKWNSRIGEIIMPIDLAEDWLYYTDSSTLISGALAIKEPS